MSRTAETCRAQRYSDGGWRSSVMPADREQSPVHEPGDDDGAARRGRRGSRRRRRGRARAGSSEGCVGRAEGADPARREWRRGGRPCTSSGLRGGQVGVKRGVVQVFGKPNRCGYAARQADPRWTAMPESLELLPGRSHRRPRCRDRTSWYQDSSCAVPPSCRSSLGPLTGARRTGACASGSRVAAGRSCLP